MNAKFLKHADGTCHASLDSPYAVLGSFLEDELGTSEQKLPFSFKCYIGWLEQAIVKSDPSTYGGDVHSLLYEKGSVVIDHNYDMHPPVKLASEQLFLILKEWADFVRSGDSSRELSI